MPPNAMTILQTAAAAVILFALFRGWRRLRLGHQSNRSIGTYAKVKKLIQSGEGVPWRVTTPPPRTLSLDEIWALDDDFEFVSALDTAIFHKDMDHGADSLTATEAAVRSARELVLEVFNGGFDQYFFNSGGDNAADVVRSLELFGAHDLAAVAKEANALFGEAGPSRRRDIRWSQMDVLSESAHEELNRLDKAVSAIEGGLDAKIAAYCRPRRDHFDLP